MPKSLSLFGRYIRNQGKFCQRTFRKYQVTKLIPGKAAGHVPSAGSQMNLWHGDDFNASWRISAFNTMYRKRTSPHVSRRDIESTQIASKPLSMAVTASALYGMDDKGGFDEYITRSSPEDIRSNMAEKMKSLNYFYKENPAVRKLDLPVNVLVRKRDRSDPDYARYQHLLKQRHSAESRNSQHTSFSPYYLPTKIADLYPQRDQFGGFRQATKLDLWWKNSKEEQTGFRARLGEAKSFEEAHPDHRIPGSFRKGEGAGGGGQGSTRPRSKTYRSRQTRTY